MQVRPRAWLTIGIVLRGALAVAEDARPRVVEEIVVTARKVEENIQDVPLAVTAITGAGLEQTLTFEMEDLGLRVPNMIVVPGGAQPTALTFQIRGQVQGDIIGTLDPSIGLYDDGVYVARPHGANASFVDVESVQVLRGPQGTLFGRNTTGGAVLLSTNDPDFEGVSGSLRAMLGSFERRSFDGVLNLPLVTDTVALRLVGQTTSTDGYGFDETNDRDIATEGTELLRVKLLYEPFDGLRFLLAGQFMDVDMLGSTVQPVVALAPSAETELPCCLAFLNATLGGVDYDSFAGGDPDRVNYDPGLEPTSRIRVRSLTLTGTWDQPWATVKFIGGVRENANAANHLDIDGSPSKIVDTVQTNENLQQSYELQATGSWLEDSLGWAAGVFYFDESGEDGGTTMAFLPLLAVINPIVTRGVIDNRSIAGYVQATYSLTEKLRLTGGVRHTRDSKRLVLDARSGGSCSVPEGMRDPGTECQGTFDDDFGNTSYIAGADYRLLENAWGFDHLLLYASATTGYRAGGQNLRGTSAATLAPFDLESLLQLEGGFKSDLFGRRVRLNAAGFYTFYDDIQRTVIVASNSVLPATVVSNAADARVAGAELELSWLPPVDGLQLEAFFGLTLPEYREFTDASGDRSNERFDFVAERSYSVSGAYTRDIFGASWLGRVDYSWKDDVPTSQGPNITYFRNQGVEIEPAATQPPTGILNVRSALTFPVGIEAGLWGRNLTDERTFTALVLGGGIDFAARINNNAPREFGGDLTVRF